MNYNTHTQWNTLQPLKTKKQLFVCTGKGWSQKYIVKWKQVLNSMYRKQNLHNNKGRDMYVYVVMDWMIMSARKTHVET